MTLKEFQQLQKKTIEEERITSEGVSMIPIQGKQLTELLISHQPYFYQTHIFDPSCRSALSALAALEVS